MGIFNLVFLIAAGLALAHFFCVNAAVVILTEGPVAIAWDAGLIILFGLQHSLMARRSWKRWLGQRIAEPLVRSTYVLASAVALILLFVAWQPIGGVLYELPSPWRETVWLAQALACVLVLYAAVAIDVLDLLGFRQLVTLYHGRPVTEPVFTDRGVYGLVRHPLMLALLLMLWLTPTLTADRLLLNAGFTLYILIGVALEERDLLRAFGERYQRYREQVPMLLPWRWPSPRA